MPFSRRSVSGFSSSSWAAAARAATTSTSFSSASVASSSSSRATDGVGIPVEGDDLGAGGLGQELAPEGQAGGQIPGELPGVQGRLLLGGGEGGARVHLLGAGGGALRRPRPGAVVEVRRLEGGDEGVEVLQPGLGPGVEARGHLGHRGEPRRRRQLLPHHLGGVAVHPGLGRGGGGVGALAPGGPAQGVLVEGLVQVGLGGLQLHLGGQAALLARQDRVDLGGVLAEGGVVGPGPVGGEELDPQDVGAHPDRVGAGQDHPAPDPAGVDQGAVPGVQVLGHHLAADGGEAAVVAGDGVAVEAELGVAVAAHVQGAVGVEELGAQEGVALEDEDLEGGLAPGGGQRAGAGGGAPAAANGSGGDALLSQVPAPG
jgi:hypothetical protein